MNEKITQLYKTVASMTGAKHLEEKSLEELEQIIFDHDPDLWALFDCYINSYIDFEKVLDKPDDPEYNTLKHCKDISKTILVDFIQTNKLD